MALRQPAQAWPRDGLENKRRRTAPPATASIESPDDVYFEIAEIREAIGKLLARLAVLEDRMQGIAPDRTGRTAPWYIG